MMCEFGEKMDQWSGNTCFLPLPLEVRLFPRKATERGRERERERERERKKEREKERERERERDQTP